MTEAFVAEYLCLLDPGCAPLKKEHSLHCQEANQKYRAAQYLQERQRRVQQMRDAGADVSHAAVRIFRGRMVGYIRGTKRRSPFLLLRGRLSRDVPLDDPRAWCTCVNQKHRTFRVRRIELGAR